jgi:hypothetical protein
MEFGGLLHPIPFVINAAAARTSNTVRVRNLVSMKYNEVVTKMQQQSILKRSWI